MKLSAKKKLSRYWTFCEQEEIKSRKSERVVTTFSGAETMGSRKGGGRDFIAEEEGMVNFAQVPTSFGNQLRACLRCRLVKTYDQFRESGCENCPFLELENDNVANCTTPNFTGIISVMDPSRSWAARWLRIGRFIPGCYALAVSDELPEEYQNICSDNNVQYVPPRRI